LGLLRPLDPRLGELMVKVDRDRGGKVSRSFRFPIIDVATSGDDVNSAKIRFADAALVTMNMIERAAPKAAT